jgi:probable phosphoglycerate mutase
MTMTKITLVRHGQTAWNADGRFMGQLNIPLDETGLAQAQVVAQRLRKLRPDAIYASDLNRAWQTAQTIRLAIVQDAAPEPVPGILPEPRLREMSFGDWQGLSYAEIQAKFPNELKAWEGDLTSFCPPGGESLAQMAARVKAALDDILAHHVDQNLLLVAHGGSLQTLITLATGQKADRMWQFPLRNTSVSEIEFYPSERLITLLNDTCHLEKLDGRSGQADA